MMAQSGTQRRILFVFAEFGIGGEETELKLLARHLDRSRFHLEAVSCFHRQGTPTSGQDELETLGVAFDRAPWTLSFEDTIAYLARKLPAFDLVVSCQNVADIYPALERLHLRPALIELGRHVDDALAGPKHFTSRYVARTRGAREAAASRMPGRARHAVEIPAMVDIPDRLAERREKARAGLEVAGPAFVVGAVARLVPGNGLTELLRATAQLRADIPDIRTVIVGGPDPEHRGYLRELQDLAAELGLTDRVLFLGERSDVSDLLCAFDAFVCAPSGERLRHALLEAGAAGLPCVASTPTAAAEQINDGVQALTAPPGDPTGIAGALRRLAGDAGLRRRLGRALARRVAETHSAASAVRRWSSLFDAVAAERRKRPVRPQTFRSFIQGGFECSTHRRRTANGFRRLDIIAAVQHDRHAESDYRQMREHGLVTARDGMRWHLIEQSAGRYDWSSVSPMLKAARRTGTQVIWDLLHYGWPDDIDVWKPEFVSRFARFAREAAKQVRAETDGACFYCPVNEISFLAWAGGEVGYLNPHAHGRGFELKAQLVRASVAAMNEILSVDPNARFVHCDPAVNILRNPDRPHEAGDAEHFHELQFQSWEMLAGQAWPQLGGSERHLDVLGVNYYHNNQWLHHGGAIDIGHPLYRPFSRILVDVYARFGRPVMVAETGIEAERRPAWLRYVAQQVRLAMEAGVPVLGLCLYPIANHPGWDDDRDCPNGLFSAQHDGRRRDVYQPLAAEIAAQQAEFELFWSEGAAEPMLARTG